MSLRIRLSKFILQFGDFVQTLPLVIMKPDDLVEFGRQTYSKYTNVQSFANPKFVDAGLNQEELDLLNVLPSKQGDFLVLGVGGGREVIPIARMGFTVTGVDFVPEMVKLAEKNAKDRGITFTGIVQDFSKIELPDSSFDVIWLSIRMYSCIPTQKRRIEFLQRINKILIPGGFFLFQFYWDSKQSVSRFVEFIRKLIAFISFGNFGYETGDILWRNAEFLHIFSSQETVGTEIEKGGLQVINIVTNSSSINGSVVCKKPE